MVDYLLHARLVTISDAIQWAAIAASLMIHVNQTKESIRHKIYLAVLAIVWIGIAIHAYKFVLNRNMVIRDRITGEPCTFQIRNYPGAWEPGGCPDVMYDIRVGNQ